VKQRYDIGKDIHYKNYLASLSERFELRVTKDLSIEGTDILFKKEAILSKADFILLKSIKLNSPIDEYIDVKDVYSSSELILDIHAFIESSNQIKSAITQVGSTTELTHLFSTYQINGTVALHLAIAKWLNTEIYKHALLIVTLSYIFARIETEDKNELITIVYAALFHDLGLLHIDPTMFVKERKLTDEEYRYLHVHVVLSQLIVEHSNIYSEEILLAVLDHHERLDGTGYPAGKKAEEITFSGQVLAVAEVTASRFNEDFECEDLLGLELLLNINQKKLNHKLCSHVNLFTQFTDEHTVASRDPDIVISDLKQLKSVINYWSEIQTTLVPNRAVTFINRYMDNFHISFTQAGLDFSNIDFLIIMLEQDATMRQFTDNMLLEAQWQLKNLLVEIKRRKLNQIANDQFQLKSWLNNIANYSELDILNTKSKQDKRIEVSLVN
jgi:HD-GYP domain-containing protein (c-di-GMP phosphodiesterase class II)